MNFGTSDLPEVKFVFKGECGIATLAPYLLSLYHYPKKYSVPVREKMLEFLIRRDYLVSASKITDKGVLSGLKTVNKVADDGRQYSQVVYGRDIQRLLFSHVPGFKLEVDCDAGGEYHSSDEMVEDVYSFFFGKKISFKRVFAGHYFTDDEIKKLLNGDTISVECKTRFGDVFIATGMIKHVPKYNSSEMCYRFCDDEMEDNPQWYKVKKERYKQAMLKMAFIGNRQNMSFHKSTCKYAPLSASKAVGFMFYKDAIEQGYKPCNACRPCDV